MNSFIFFYNAESVSIQNSTAGHREAIVIASGPELPNDFRNESDPTTLNRRDMLDQMEETFNNTNLTSINNVLRSSSYQDLFSVTLDEFRNLTTSNIVDDSSSDENNEIEELDTIHFNRSCNTESDNPLRC